MTNPFKEPTSRTYTLYTDKIGESDHAKPDKAALILELLKQNTELTNLYLAFTQEVTALLLRHHQTLCVLQSELQKDNN